MLTKNYNKFLKTYHGVELLKRHSLEDTGVWEILGEDPNCDMGGSHIMPRLGIYEGRLEDILTLAVEKSDFWTWGAGGDIRQIKIKNIPKQDSKKILALKERQEELQKELDDIENQLTY